MLSGDRKWIALGIIVAVTYVACLAFWGLYATQGAAFVALVVAVVGGSLIRLGGVVSSKTSWSVGTTQNSGTE